MLSLPDKADVSASPSSLFPSCSHLPSPCSHFPSPCRCSHLPASACSHPASPCKPGQDSLAAPRTLHQVAKGFLSCSLATHPPSSFVRLERRLRRPCEVKRQRLRAWPCSGSQCTLLWIAADGGNWVTWGHQGHMDHLVLDGGRPCVTKERTSNSCHPSKFHSCQQALGWRVSKVFVVYKAIIKTKKFPPIFYNLAQSNSKT